MVVVIGSVHHNTLSIIRCLGMQSINPYVIICGDSRRNYIVNSKYVCGYHCINDAKDVFKVLDMIYKQCNERCCIISCSDEIASLLDLNYGKLIDKFDFFNAKEDGRITKFMDKQLQLELALKHGIKVPVSQKIKIGEQKCSFDIFPCIVKPLESINGGKKIDICYDRVELERVLCEYQQGIFVQIQEYISKDYEIVIDGLSVNDNCIIPGYIYKYRDIMGGTTFSKTGSIIDIPNELIDSIKSMIKEIVYEGLWGVELIISNGSYYFVEMNLRNDATTYSLAIAGTNLPALYAKVKMGLCRLESSYNVRAVNSIVEFRDIVFPLKFKISFLNWWRDYKSSECRYFNVPDDPKPFQIAIREFVVSICKKTFKKLLNIY